jgi:hypothetical protein
MSSTTAQVEPGQVARVDFEFSGSGRIIGTVSWPEGYDVVGVVVRDASATEPFSFETWASIQSQVLGWTRCGPDGSYEITDLPAGTYNITAVCAPEWDSPASDVRQSSRIVTIEEDQPLELNFAL